MGLLDKIVEYYHRADDFLLEKHIEMANWANENFGKSNYDLSNAAAFVPVPMATGIYFYDAITLGHEGALPFDVLRVFYTTLIGYGQLLSNRVLEEREEKSLNSLAKDAYATQIKRSLHSIGILFFSVALASIPSYTISVISGADTETKIKNLLSTAILSSWGMSVYFKIIDHNPRKKGRVPERIKNAFSVLQRNKALPEAT